MVGWKLVPTLVVMTLLPGTKKQLRSEHLSDPEEQQPVFARHSMV